MKPHLFDFQEKKEKSKTVYYIVIGILGVVAALVFILGFKLIVYLINLLIEYWIWAIAIVVGALILKSFVLRKRKRREDENTDREI